jgi:hypothetical protein
MEHTIRVIIDHKIIFEGKVSDFSLGYSRTVSVEEGMATRTEIKIYTPNCKG